MTLSERTKLRASEERKLDHAYDVLNALIEKHMPGNVGERESHELYMIKQRLMLLIKHQHAINREYVAEKIKLIDGDY